MLTTQTTSNRTQNQFRKYSIEALNAIALLIASACLRSLEQFLQYFFTILSQPFKVQHNIFIFSFIFIYFSKCKTDQVDFNSLYLTQLN